MMKDCGETGAPLSPQGCPSFCPRPPARDTVGRGNMPPPVRSSTRWHATTTTFGPTTKLLLTVPPFLFGIDMLLHAPPSSPDGAFTFFYALLLLAVAGWWARHVWIAGSQVMDGSSASVPCPVIAKAGPCLRECRDSALGTEPASSQRSEPPWEHNGNAALPPRRHDLARSDSAAQYPGR